MGDMVSRHRRPGPPLQSSLAALFGTWRAILTRAVTGGSRLARAAVSAPLRALRSLGENIAAARSGSAPARERLAPLVGLAAVITGVLATTLIAPPGTRMHALPAAVVAGMWATARLPVMRLVSERLTSARAGTVAPAWATGALLHVFAVSPGLRVFAWAGGAALTYRALRSSDSSARDAAVITGWGYGLEVAGFALVAVARSLQVAVLWLGGTVR